MQVVLGNFCVYVFNTMVSIFQVLKVKILVLFVKLSKQLKLAGIIISQTEAW